MLIYSLLSRGQAMSRSRSPAGRIRPLLETLEPRRCLATIAQAVGDLLLVRGDELDNEVAIVDEGANGVSIIILDDPIPHLFPGIRRIALQMRGGDDHVQVALGGPDTLVGKFSAALGTGTDMLDLAFADLGGKALRVNVSGEGGDDWLSFHDVEEMTGALAISASGGGGDDWIAYHEVDEFDGALSFSALGGGGEDYLAFHEVDEVVGKLSVALDGAGGDDVMIHEVDSVAGYVSLAMKGGAGNDSMLSRVGFNPQPDPPGRAAQIVMDGGAGDDNVSHWMGFQPPDRLAAVAAFVPAGSFSVSIKGGTGDDFVDAVFDLGTVPTGRLRARLDGGDGDDLVSAAFASIGDPNETVLSVLGGNGNDQLAIDVPSWTPGPDDNVLWLADGGEGLDEALLPRGIRNRRCEFIILQ
jgi:hypothetical protein